MSLRVDVSPRVISWARERARLDVADLTGKFPRVGEWGSTVSPTLKQLEAFARTTHTPVGMLFLIEPPEEHVPIPDYRTIGSAEVARPSADLLDTIYQCQQRQDWYGSFAQLQGAEPVPLVGSISTGTSPDEAADAMRLALAFEPSGRGSSYPEALSRLSEAAENLGILVMVNGVVGNNTHRKLDPQEFRGFALVDPLAPLVFVNGADTKGAQIFTLAHELAHLWIGKEGLDSADPGARSTIAEERWCNEVAAEFLAPASTLEDRFDPAGDLMQQLEPLARIFKVSTLVILRRLHDTGAIDRATYRDAYREELARALDALREGPAQAGGDFFKTQPVRVSKRFARALIESTLEGQTLYTEAFEMLGVKRTATFDALAARLGVA